MAEIDHFRPRLTYEPGGKVTEFTGQLVFFADGSSLDVKRALELHLITPDQVPNMPSQPLGVFAQGAMKAFADKLRRK